MNYQKKDIIKGVVTGIKSYGIFVNIEQEYSGLIHISQIDYHFIDDINEFVKIGEEIYCEVLDVDYKNNQLTLSIKNINYRGDGQRKNLDKEGFEILKNNLKDWVNIKLAEIEAEENEKN